MHKLPYDAMIIINDFCFCSTNILPKNSGSNEYMQIANIKGSVCCIFGGECNWYQLCLLKHRIGFKTISLKNVHSVMMKNIARSLYSKSNILIFLNTFHNVLELNHINLLKNKLNQYSEGFQQCICFHLQQIVYV